MIITIFLAKTRINILHFRSSRSVQKYSVKKIFLNISQNSQENTRSRVSFSKKLQSWHLQLSEKIDSAQAFSCEFCEISKNTYFHRAPLTAASGTSFCFYFPFFLNKSFFETLAKHQTNLRSILRSQLFIQNKSFIELREREAENKVEQI